NQALARVLYQQERFGMLGCDPTPTPTCTSPGGIGSDRSGNALIPSGPASGASPNADLGTENGDAAVAELTSEEGSVLFKNDNRPASSSAELPIQSSDLTPGNVALIGAAAEYAIASPSREASQGFPERIAVNPLTTLGSLSGHPDSFVNVPALSPTGFPVPTSALKTPTDGAGLSRTTGPSSPSTDSQLDFTSVNGNQLAAGTSYAWQGCVWVPSSDGYTFRFQNTPTSTVTFGLSTDAVGTAASTTLAAAANAGDTNIKVGSVANLAPGYTITIDTGAGAENATIQTVGTAGATGTGLTLAGALASAHASGASVVGAGPSITTLAAASAAGATNIKVASVSGFTVGQTVVVDTGASKESAVITTVGTAGATGTGLTLASALTNAHATGAMVALGGPGSAGEGTSTSSCSAAWATLGANTPVNRTLSTASTFYQGHYQGNVPVATTNAGYTDPGMQNRQFPSGVVGTAGASVRLSGGEYYAVNIGDATPASGPASFRFAYSRVNGDDADAAAAAAGKGMAIVFVNDQAVPDGSGPTSIVAGIGQNYVNLINAVAAANPNTVVILQSAYADTVDSWLPNVKALLETWNSGQEGAVATARLLLGQANPSGHTAMTWPKGPNDSIWGYNETTPLYPGDTTGTHPERLNGGPGGSTLETEGIYTGYRFFDQEGIAPEFPFGFGLSYTTFGFSKESVSPSNDGGLDVSVRVKNTGSVRGDEVVQVYLGPPSNRPDGVQFAPRSLSQFARISLDPGETEAVKLHIAPRQLEYWSEAAQRWTRT
ncbi:MAG TPA: glycoside hydrolase family 3 C-terminal domain-containing protein, partial [Acidimicrobiia bacterium]|nr:glycoside hydrolase family 3 C-terminal domain-containing protein [Acidimicrobiia bacterium]